MAIICPNTIRTQRINWAGTLQGTNISNPKALFENEFPLPSSSQHGICYGYVRVYLPPWILLGYSFYLQPSPQETTFTGTLQPSPAPHEEFGFWSRWACTDKRILFEKFESCVKDWPKSFVGGPF